MVKIILFTNFLHPLFNEEKQYFYSYFHVQNNSLNIGKLRVLCLSLVKLEMQIIFILPLNEAIDLHHMINAKNEKINYFEIQSLYSLQPFWFNYNFV